VPHREAQPRPDGYVVSDNDAYAGWTYGGQVYAPGSACVFVNVILSDGIFKRGEVYRTLCWARTDLRGQTPCLMAGCVWPARG
jgi:hypothetical protein